MDRINSKQKYICTHILELSFEKKFLNSANLLKQGMYLTFRTQKLYHVEVSYKWLKLTNVSEIAME
jgi:hypothetical protein